MSALSELLNRAFAERYPDTSNRKIADEAGVSRGTIDNYRRGTHPAVPSDEVLSAFHKLLKIPMSELREAAGLPVGEDVPYVPPREANMLSDRQRRALDELIRSFVDTRGASHADQPTPASPPATQSGTPREEDEDEKTRAGGKPADLNPEDQASNVEPLRPRHRRGRNFDDNPIIEADAAAYDPGEPTEEERRDEDGEERQ